MYNGVRNNRHLGPAGYNTNIAGYKDKVCPCCGTNLSERVAEVPMIPMGTPMTQEEFCVLNQIQQRTDSNRMNMQKFYAAPDTEPKKEKKGIFVLFSATWCGHCKMFRPLWENIKKENESDYYFVDINETDIPETVLGSPNISRVLKTFKIRGFPSLYFIFASDGEYKALELMNRNNIITEVKTKLGDNTKIIL